MRLLSRRNARGHYSERGHTYVWEVFEKPKGNRIEIVVHFDYGTKKAKNLIQFQVHVFGPSTATDAECVEAIRRFEKGEKPQGWKWKEIFWAHPPKFDPAGPIEEERDEDGEQSEEAQRLRAPRRAAIFSPEEVRVARKNPVRKLGRTNGKAKRKKGDTRL